MADKNITIIIPNYNGMKFLPRCIESLDSQSAEDFDVLIVDNGSTDGSIEWINARIAERESGKVPGADYKLSLIALPENKGFAGGVNEGLRACESEYVILLNNDTECFCDFVEQLEKTIEKSDGIFAVSALMIKAADHSLVDSAGDGITIVGWAYQRGIDEKVSLYEKPKRVFSACAGAAIYRKKALDEIGYFDEMHFAYLEDLDISYRAALAGYRTYYQPGARVYHLGSATSGSRYNDFKVRLTSRNNIYLHYKNQPAVQLMINFIPLAIGVAGKAVFFKKKGFSKAYSEGIKEGFATCRQCRKAKRARGGIGTYLYIEGVMIAGFLEYLISFIKRHV